MQQTQAPRHRSYSQINQLRRCGYQFKLERLDRVPSRPSAPAVAGTAVHTGTEIVDEVLAADVPDRDYVIATACQAADAALDLEILAYRQKGWEPADYKSFGRATAEKPKGEDVGWFRQVGIPNSITAYVDWRLSTPDLVIAEVPDFGPAIEVPFNYYIGNQLVTGFIDRVFTSETIGGFYPLDIKSGRRPETDEQLGLYARALHKALGWDIQWGYYLYGLKLGTAKLTPPLMLSHWTDEKLGSVYLPATKIIDLGLYIPHPGDACRICSVSDSCEFVQSLV